jgi:primase-polymerase (primpol)-like protein
MDTKSSVNKSPAKMKTGLNKPPKFLEPNFEQMPPDLTKLPNWVLWHPFWTGTKWSKRPIQPSGYGASTTNPDHWCSFEDATRAYKCAVERGYMEVPEKNKPLQRVPIGGVGFVFDGKLDERGLVLGGVDFDQAITAAGIRPFPRKCIKRLGSYTERSVSGGGLHVIAWVRPLESGISYKHIEMYTIGRFFTMTGRAKAGARIKAAPEVFTALAGKLRAASAAAKAKDRDSSSGNSKKSLPRP